MSPSRSRPSALYSKTVTEGSGAREWDMIVRICGTRCVAPGRCRTDDGRYVVLGKPAAKSGKPHEPGQGQGKRRTGKERGKHGLARTGGDLSRGNAAASATVTSSPARAAQVAVADPAGPAPTTSTSVFSTHVVAASPTTASVPLRYFALWMLRNSRCSP